MLMPRKVAHRKHHRGRTKGMTKGGSGLHFGDYGIQALEPGWLTARQIEAARIAMTRHAKRGAQHGLIKSRAVRAITKAVERRRLPPQQTALGGQIGIHGGGGGGDWTLGCIAVSDEEAKWLFDRLRLGDRSEGAWQIRAF